MTNDRYWINLISTRLERFSWVDDGKVAACRCPICGDSHKNVTKKRFYFFLKSGKYRVYCHNCNYSATLYSFLKKMFPDVAKQYVFENFTKNRSLRQISDFHSDKFRKSIPPNEEDSFRQMENWDFSSCIRIENLPKDHFVAEYVKNRLIPPENVLYCPNVNMIVDRCDRIKDPVPTLLIPYKRKGKPTEVFQIRFFDPRRKPKYLTFKYEETSLKIWNLDFVNQDNPVYVTEGPIDAMMIKNSIAMGGSNLMSAKQYVKNPILIYDNEPRSPIICKKLWMAIEAGCHVVIFPDGVHQKDLNDMAIRGHNVQKLVEDNTFNGLNAKLVYHSWKKC